MRYVKLQPEEITIGKRFRKDYGDIDEMAQSILEKGLLQNIVVDQNKELCAGGRRLQGFIRAREIDPNNPNVKFIPATQRKVESELDLREIELFENIHRKDMNWSEKADLVSEIHSLMVEKEGDAWSLRKTSDMISSSVGSVTDQVNIAKAMKAFPDLRKQPTFDAARKVYKRALESAQLEAAVKKMNQRAEPGAEPQWKGKEFNFDYWYPILDKTYTIGDFFEEAAKIPDGSFHFAEVDPPYGIDLESVKSEKSANIAHYNEVDTDKYVPFLERATKEVYRLLKNDSFCVWWFGQEWYPEVVAALKAAGFHVDIIPAIWNKVEAGSGTNNPEIYLSRSYETFIVCRKGSPLIRQRGRRNGFDFKPEHPGRKIHPTERPVELIREIYRTFVFPGADILIPFLGSGASIVAAFLEGMNNIVGFDLSKVYKEKFIVKGQLALTNKSIEMLREKAIEEFVPETHKEDPEEAADWKGFDNVEEDDAGSGDSDEVSEGGSSNQAEG